MRLSFVLVFAMPPSRFLLRFSSMSRHSPYAIICPNALTRASSRRAFVHMLAHGSLLRANKKPPAFSDKRKYQQHELWSVCSFQSMCKHTWIQISTWSGLEKAYLIKPFSFFSCGHNGSLKIIRAICIAWIECMYLQHCLSFPNLRFYFFWHPL